MFNIDFTYLIQSLIPVILRKPKEIAWVSLILSYVKKLYNEFVAFKNEKLYDINFTGQTMYLEKKLNDTFSVTGIFISDGKYYLPLYLFNDGEDFLPVYTGNNFISERLYNVGEWVVYIGYWYEYTGNGNGLNPELDPNARIDEKIAIFQGNDTEDGYELDFYVNVPEAVFDAFSEDEILKLKKIIDYYKLVEMRYEIKTY